MDYSINKGIGKPAEFKGLKSQYLFIFAGGLLGLFIVFFELSFKILQINSIRRYVCLPFFVYIASTPKK
jgi:hypothetical protein